MKIVFIGAGMAALTAAEKLGKAGCDVEIYEKNGYENLSYDWHDDVNADAFEKFDLPMPNEGTYFRKRNWTFIPPGERTAVSLELPEAKLDFSVERRPLAQQYVNRAKDVVKFRFGTKVDSLIIEDKKVKGIRVDGKNVYADLVVDNSGAVSSFRAALPKEFGITPMPGSNEIFYAYRGFHERTADAPEPKYTNEVYLMHLREVGISWCIADPSGTVNVLIGRAGGLSDKTFKAAYSHIKAANPILSDKVVRGGTTCLIPIRYPLTRMVGDGYAAIGDAAFMTIPMLGSGIENSMKAGCVLADVILKNNSVDKENLWRYQVAYYRMCGAKHIGVDVLKRWMLTAKPGDIDFLFEHKIVDKDDLSAGATGNLIYIDLKNLLKKAARGFIRIDLLLMLNGVINKTKKAAKCGLEIPEIYDEEAISMWERKIECFF